MREKTGHAPRFRRVIEEEIHKARSGVVLWSATSIASDWVIEEASKGNERGILLPVLIEKVRPPMDFRSTHAADLVGGMGRGCAAIGTLIGTAAKDGLPYVWIAPGEF